MSKLHDFEGLSLRAGEVELLLRARRAAQLGRWEQTPDPIRVIALIERLGRVRAARDDDPNWRARAEIAEARAAAIERTAGELLAKVKATRGTRGEDT